MARFKFVSISAQLSCAYLDPRQNCYDVGASSLFDKTRAFIYNHKMLGREAGTRHVQVSEITDPSVLISVVQGQCHRCHNDSTLHGCEAR